MSDGQARVLMLLVFLGLLEIAVHPAIKTFLQTGYANITGNIGVRNT